MAAPTYAEIDKVKLTRPELKRISQTAVNIMYELAISAPGDKSTITGYIKHLLKEYKLTGLRNPDEF